MITTCFKPKKTRKNCTFLKSFFKKSYFNLFNNKSLIFFDNLIAKELYFSKLCHLWVLEDVFIAKFYICRVLTVKKQAVLHLILSSLVAGTIGRSFLSTSSLLFDSQETTLLLGSIFKFPNGM